MLRVGRNVSGMCACVGMLGVWLEKYRLFYVALTLCFTVSFVGGWLNESFGLGLRYQKLWFGPGRGGGGWDVKEKEKPTCTCGFWNPGAYYCTVTRPSRYLQHVVRNISATTVSNYPQLFCWSAERHVFPFAFSRRVLLVCNELDVHHSGAERVSDTVE